MDSEFLGFVGIGRMGGPMSSRLLDAGHSLCIFDTNPDVMKSLIARGAKPAASAAEVASAAPRSRSPIYSPARCRWFSPIRSRRCRT